MPESTETRKYILSNFDREQKTFILENQADDTLTFAVNFNINLQGLSNGENKLVKTDNSLDDYACIQLINPYLNAQGDVFKVNIKVGSNTKSVGYIFPASALGGDEEDIDDNFDEAKQAYKFYSIKNLIEQHKWNEHHEGQSLNISEILNQNCSFIIIYKPLLQDVDFKLTDLLPNLALHGYYHNPENTKPNISNLFDFGSARENLEEIIKVRYLFVRDQQSITLKNSKAILNQIPLIKLLYDQLLVEADNPLYRFLILYQVVEYLVDKYFKDGLETVINERASYSNYKFLQQIHELNNTRSTINKLFDTVSFDAKSEITSILKSFLLEFEHEYEKHSTGDCLYDIRNLLFHDYKSVLEGQRDGAILGLVIQCEILIHQLVITLGLKNDNPITA